MINSNSNSNTDNWSIQQKYKHVCTCIYRSMKAENEMLDVITALKQDQIVLKGELERLDSIIDMTSKINIREVAE